VEIKLDFQLRDYTFEHMAEKDNTGWGDDGKRKLKFWGELVAPVPGTEQPTECSFSWTSKDKSLKKYPLRSVRNVEVPGLALANIEVQVFEFGGIRDYYTSLRDNKNCVTITSDASHKWVAKIQAYKAATDFM